MCVCVDSVYIIRFVCCARFDILDRWVCQDACLVQRNDEMNLKMKRRPPNKDKNQHGRQFEEQVHLKIGTSFQHEFSIWIHLVLLMVEFLHQLILW